MEVFFIKYRKLLIALCVILLVYLPFEVYSGIENFNSGHTGRGIGVLLNAGITFLLVPLYLLVTTGKAYRKFKEGNININTNDDVTAGS
jgi:hypothetical protein